MRAQFNNSPSSAEPGQKAMSIDCDCYLGVAIFSFAARYDAPHGDRSLVNLSHYEQFVTKVDESSEPQIEIARAEIIDRRFRFKSFATGINT